MSFCLECLSASRLSPTAKGKLQKGSGKVAWCCPCTKPRALQELLWAVSQFFETQLMKPRCSFSQIQLPQSRALATAKIFTRCRNILWAVTLPAAPEARRGAECVITYPMHQSLQQPCFQQDSLCQPWQASPKLGSPVAGGRWERERRGEKQVNGTVSPLQVIWKFGQGEASHYKSSRCYQFCGCSLPVPCCWGFFPPFF